MKAKASMSLRVLLATAALVAGQSAAETGAPPAHSSLQPTHYELDLRVDFKEERISGSARVTLKNTGGSPAREASFLLYRLMTVAEIRDARGEAIPFRQAIVAFEDDPRRQVNHVLMNGCAPMTGGGEQP